MSKEILVGQKAMYQKPPLYQTPNFVSGNQPEMFPSQNGPTTMQPPKDGPKNKLKCKFPNNTCGTGSVHI